MKKIVGILVGVCLCLMSIIGFDRYLDNSITKHKEVIRNHRSYERFWSREVAKLVMDENTLPVFGSSELMPLEDYNNNISSFLNSDDMNIMTIGAGYFQSLSHTMTLGAIGNDIPSGTVALFVSPQWFAEGGISAEAFPERFSEDELLGFLDNEKISWDSKQYVLERTEQLLVNSPTQCQRIKKYKDAMEESISVDKVYTRIMDEFWKIRAKYAVYKQIPAMEEKLPVVDLKNMDWDDMYALAEKQGEETCTNNEFGIGDDYWDTYVKTVYEEGEVQNKCQVYTESTEYEDLRCFLNVAKELDIEVLLVSVPVNEKWYEYEGLLCNEYYNNIREIASQYSNVKLIDMTEYAGEKYFLRDIMHLGWKGWTRVNEALYKEFTN